MPSDVDDDAKVELIKMLMLTVMPTCPIRV